MMCPPKIGAGHASGMVPALQIRCLKEHMLAETGGDTQTKTGRVWAYYDKGVDAQEINANLFCDPFASLQPRRWGVGARDAPDAEGRVVFHKKSVVDYC